MFSATQTITYENNALIRLLIASKILIVSKVNGERYTNINHKNTKKTIFNSYQ